MSVEEIRERFLRALALKNGVVVDPIARYRYLHKGQWQKDIQTLLDELDKLEEGNTRLAKSLHEANVNRIKAMDELEQEREKVMEKVDGWKKQAFLLKKLSDELENML